MAELRLISILPPQGVQQPSQVASGASQSPILPAALAGSILSGFILNRDNAGNPILRTPSGDITFASNFFLKIGSEVVIRVENRAGNTLAHILSVDGQSPEAAAARSSFAGEPDVLVGKEQADAKSAQASAPLPSDVIRSTGNPTLNAVVLSTPATAEGDAPPALPAGSTLTLKLTAIAPPQPATAGAAVSVAGTTAPTPATPNATLYAAYGTPGPAPSFPAAPASVNVFTPAAAPSPAVSAQGAAISPAATPVNVAPGQSITATVIGSEPTGEAVVQTNFGIVRLSPGSVLAPGSTLTFNVETVSTAAGALTSALRPGAPESLAGLARNWESLQQIVTLLAARPDAIGLPAAGLPTLLATPANEPATAQTVSTGLLFFIAALRGGDIGNWLGKSNARRLEEAGYGELLKKAGGEFSTIAKHYADTASQPWQMLFFPVAAHGEVQQARLFVKRDRKKSSAGQDKKSDDTRFVVEMDMSQLGPMQMDGFVRKQENALEFDLVIRSHAPLADEVKNGIQTIYAQMADITGYKGALQFQAVREFPVKPMEEALTHAIGDVVV